MKGTAMLKVDRLDGFWIIHGLPDPYPATIRIDDKSQQEQYDAIRQTIARKLAASAAPLAGTPQF